MPQGFQVSLLMGRKVFVEDGKELNVYGKADELGFTRLK